MLSSVSAHSPKEPLLKVKAQYGRPPCTNGSVHFCIENIIYHFTKQATLTSSTVLSFSLQLVRPKEALRLLPRCHHSRPLMDLSSYVFLYKQVGILCGNKFAEPGPAPVPSLSNNIA